MTTAAPAFHGCVFLGLSVDGFIARPDGDLSWLTSRGEAAGDAGFTPFMESINALIMGRGTYDVIAGETDWPYLGRPVAARWPLTPTVGSRCTRASTTR